LKRNVCGDKGCKSLVVQSLPVSPTLSKEVSQVGSRSVYSSDRNNCIGLAKGKCTNNKEEKGL
jgi:hypothetical protein